MIGSLCTSAPTRYTRLGHIPRYIFVLCPGNRFSGSARRAAIFVPSRQKHGVEPGHELDLLQQGLDPTDFKPMPAVGNGVYELRVRLDGAFRVFYVAKFAEGIYVLHAFTKKTRQTARLDIEVGAKRYRHLMEQRRSD